MYGVIRAEKAAIASPVNEVQPAELILPTHKPRQRNSTGVLHHGQDQDDLSNDNPQDDAWTKDKMAAHTWWPGRRRAVPADQELGEPGEEGSGAIVWLIPWLCARWHVRRQERDVELQCTASSVSMAS
jgi:hypothetical protein